MTIQKALALVKTVDLNEANIASFEKDSKKQWLPQLVQAEVNTLSLPYAVLNEREAKNSLGHELVKFEKHNSSQIVWQWQVWPAPRHGMPTIFTLRVLFGLMEIAQESKQRFGYIPERLDIGSLNGFCKRIGVIQDSHHRKLIRKHIEVLIYTTCKSKGAFKTKQGKGLILDRFSYLKRAVFAGQKDADGNLMERNLIEFDETFQTNLETSYIKSIDVAFMRQLKSPVAQLLYTHLSHLFHDLNGWAYVDPDYMWLSERMGLKVYSELKRARQQFKQGIAELVECHYLEKAEWVGWKIHFYPGVRYTLGEYAPKIERKQKARNSKRNLSDRQGNSISIQTSQIQTSEEIRELVLIRQATRIMLRQSPDEQLLLANNWTVEDAIAKSNELKHKSN